MIHPTTHNIPREMEEMEKSQIMETLGGVLQQYLI